MRIPQEATPALLTPHPPIQTTVSSVWLKAVVLGECIEAEDDVVMDSAEEDGGGDDVLREVVAGAALVGNPADDDEVDEPDVVVVFGAVVVAWIDVEVASVLEAAVSDVEASVNSDVEVTSAASEVVAVSVELFSSTEELELVVVGSGRMEEEGVGVAGEPVECGAEKLRIELVDVTVSVAVDKLPSSLPVVANVPVVVTEVSDVSTAAVVISDSAEMVVVEAVDVVPASGPDPEMLWLKPSVEFPVISIGVVPCTSGPALASSAVEVVASPGCCLKNRVHNTKTGKSIFLQTFLTPIKRDAIKSGKNN